MHGFQLWANLPRELKMTDPRYQDIKSGEIPVLAEDDGTAIRVVVGDYKGVSGPVDGVAAEPNYFDISIPAGKTKRFKVDTYRRAFAYVFEGSGTFRDASEPFGVLTEKEVGGQEVVIREKVGNRSMVIFGAGDEVVATAGEEGMRFLLVSGAPIQEPVAWHGPIVMNTRDELVQAFNELRSGDFIKKSA
jgi:hypothetical protein